MNLNMVFDFVLASTVNGTIVGSIIFLMRKLAGRILPYKFKVLLWAVFIIKLFFPFGPESELSVFNFEYIHAEYNIKEIFLENIGEPSGTEVKTINILPMIWFLGFIITGLWLLLSNLTFSLKLKIQSQPINDRISNVFQGCKDKLNIKREIRLVNQSVIKGASLFGIIRPKIIITDQLENFTDREIEYIFYHELSHYKRKDIFANYLVALIQVIHWFNPLVHIFAKVIRQDIELATDEKTMSLIENRECKSYGLALISMLEEYSKIFSPGLLRVADSKRHIKKRIREISSYRSKGKLSLCVFLVLIISISLVTLTTAVPVKSTNINEISNEIIKKEVQKQLQSIASETVIKVEETKEMSKVSPVIEKTPEIQKKEPDIPNETLVSREDLVPNAKVNKLLPGNDFNMVLNGILNEGRRQEHSQNVNLNYSCAIREFGIKENTSISLGTFIPNHSGNISLYIESDSSQRLNIILVKDGEALINASVKPSKTNSYSFENLDKKDNYELILTCKHNSEYTSNDISGTVIVF